MVLIVSFHNYDLILNTCIKRERALRTMKIRFIVIWIFIVVVFMTMVLNGIQDIFFRPANQSISD